MLPRYSVTSRVEPWSFGDVYDDLNHDR
uniref:Uncharacterized protein n=1 Tax=Arundo donax TaxID=35708 RepID=A0A0A8Y848_ARUDO